MKTAPSSAANLMLRSAPTAAFSCYGGKQRLASKIVRLLPPHTVYVEPFCGGGSMLFAKGKPPVTNTDHYREVINDYDKRIVNFYRVMQDRTQAKELLRRLRWTTYSRAEHIRAKMILKEESGDTVSRAWAWFVKIEQSFAHILHGGWKTSVCSENHGATWQNTIRDISSIRGRLANVHVECLDALSCIKKWDSPQTVFYCDPPYPETDQGDYRGYTLADFAQLCETLNTCQGSFLLSCYDTPTLAQYSHWERFIFEAHCSASAQGKTGADRTRKVTAEELGNRKRAECVFRVDRSYGIRKELRDVTFSDQPKQLGLFT